MPEHKEMVSLTIDGVVVRVPKGTNLIEAVKSVGTEVPHYCYHPDLSIAGNCRMCQVEIEGSPKLTIACNTGAQEGMVVKTQRTSDKAAQAQRATLEFLLINHPLDCTVCDQAGHCKLQDYYYEYNAKPSRFIEDKVHKVKAEILGPEVVYDGERCILCTRCVRFCDEVTKSGELGLFNRGDHAVIGVHPDAELNNPLSGTVVDLCPVGALTHRKWRFNSRIWYTSKVSTVCPGCSTGCNASVWVRDGQVVHVKARYNAEVNKEWMCDEGRYGFERFQPQERLRTPLIRTENYLQESTLEQALAVAAKLKATGDAGPSTSGIFISPFLTLEEIWVAVEFARSVLGLQPGSGFSGGLAVQYRARTLTEMEQVLISPDYAPNARAISLFGLGTSENWRQELESSYQALLTRVRNGEIKRLIFVGDGAVHDSDLDQPLIQGILQAEVSVSIGARGVISGDREDTEQTLGAHQLCQVLLPGLTVNEKNGIFLNASDRFQRLRAALEAPSGGQQEWKSLVAIAAAAGVGALLPSSITDDRALFREMVKRVSEIANLSLMAIGEEGTCRSSLAANQYPTNSSESHVSS